jgi:hypothetical protein
MRYLTLHYCKGTTVSIIQNIFSARIPAKGHITYPQQISMTMFFAVQKGTQKCSAYQRSPKPQTIGIHTKMDTYLHHTGTRHRRANWLGPIIEKAGKRTSYI